MHLYFLAAVSVSVFPLKMWDEILPALETATKKNRVDKISVTAQAKSCTNFIKFSPYLNGPLNSSGRGHSIACASEPPASSCASGAL